MPGHTTCCTCHAKHRKTISANLKIWCSKTQLFPGNQRPDLLTSLMKMSLVLRLPRKIHLCRSSSHVPRLPIFSWKCYKTFTLAGWRIPCVYHTNDASTSKSGANMWCFVHFDFDMCFAPQRRALFAHLNFPKVSERGVLCTFWLRNVLCATTAWAFSTSQLPKVLRTWGDFSFFTSKSASHLTGVQFLISHLARWLRTRRFSKPTFRPCGTTNHWKNTMFRDFSTFSRTCIFFPLTLSLLWSSFFSDLLPSLLFLFLFSSVLFSSLLFSSLLFSSLLWLFPPLLFHLSISSEVWLLNFLRLFHLVIVCSMWYSSWQPKIRRSRESLYHRYSAPSSPRTISAQSLSVARHSKPKCTCFTLQDSTGLDSLSLQMFWQLSFGTLVCGVSGAGSTCVEWIGLCRAWWSMLQCVLQCMLQCLLQCMLQCVLLKVLENIRKYGYHEITHPGQVRSGQQYCSIFLKGGTSTCLFTFPMTGDPFCCVATSFANPWKYSCCLQPAASHCFMSLLTILIYQWVCLRCRPMKRWKLKHGPTSPSLSHNRCNVFAWKILKAVILGCATNQTCIAWALPTALRLGRESGPHQWHSLGADLPSSLFI